MSRLPVLFLLLAAMCGAGESWAMLDGLAPFYNPERPPPRSWAMPVSHIDTLTPPYIDQAHLAASLERFERYCERAAARGYDAVFIGNVVHLASFDGVEGGPVYAPASPFRLRAAAYREAFRAAAASADRHGLRLVIETDFPAWTTALETWLGPGGVSLDNPRLWEAWRAAVDEVFDATGAAALSVRVGEGGGAYDEPATGYRSGISVTTVEATQRAIAGLLGLVEDYNVRRGASKRLLFRTWTIGIGEIGALHTDPELYERVFAPFYGRDALLTVIKHVAMDFFCHVPLNPTIGVGELPQVVEFQARREYEGFGLFPNYRARPFAEALARFSRQDTFAGISVWPTNGGFLYPARRAYSADEEAWIDANVHAYGRLLADPTRDPRALAREWAEERGLAGADAERVASILLRGEEIIERGWYIVPYAERAPALFGLDVFPTLLWHYWTRTVTAYGVQGLIAEFALADLERSLADGQWAVAELDALLAEAALLPASPFRARLLAALEYQRSLLAVLERYRAVLLYHQAWTRSGDRGAYQAWQAALPELAARVDGHEQAYGQDPLLPAMDLSEVRRMLRDDAWIPTLRPVAGVLAAWLLLLGALVLLPQRVVDRLPRVKGAGGGFLLCATAAASCGAAVGVLTTGYRFAAVAGLSSAAALLVCLAPALCASLAGRGPRSPWTASATLLAPALAGLALALAVFAARGPARLHLVYVQAALHGHVRTGVMVLAGLFALGQLAALVLALRRGCRRGRRALAGVGAALLVLGASVGGLLAAGPVDAILALNDVTRVAPTILGEAGTGVEDLLE